MSAGRAFGALLFLSVFLPLPLQAAELKPHKDRLFSYPATLSQSHDGRYRVLAYDEQRDINARDEVPERRVRSNYVSLKIRKSQVEIELEGLRWFAVGNRDSPNIITLYVHGKGGGRRQGVDDFSFGGNFNRIKNLMAGNGGLYLSPDVRDFEEMGARDVSAILRHYHWQAPSAPIFVACGSMGAVICYRLAQDPEIARTIRGFILLGAPSVSSFFASSAFQQRTPVFLGHGSRDKVYPIDTAEKFFAEFERRAPNYPVRLYRFEGGSHGTPIRMIDWRETLNWMMKVR